MHPDASILMAAMDRHKRDAVTLILAAAHIEGMPDCYSREQQELDVVLAVHRAEKGGYLRMLLVAILAILRGRTWALAQQRIGQIKQHQQPERTAA
jgi:hypothetical protein